MKTSAGAIISLSTSVRVDTLSHLSAITLCKPSLRVYLLRTASIALLSLIERLARVTSGLRSGLCAGGAEGGGTRLRVYEAYVARGSPCSSRQAKPYTSNAYKVSFSISYMRWVASEASNEFWAALNDSIFGAHSAMVKAVIIFSLRLVLGASILLNTRRGVTEVV